MDKPYILMKEDMKKDISEAVNRHINNVFASDISEFLLKIAGELERVANEQLENARKQYESAKEESENDSK